MKTKTSKLSIVVLCLISISLLGACNKNDSKDSSKDAKEPKTSEVNKEKKVETKTNKVTVEVKDSSK